MIEYVDFMGVPINVGDHVYRNEKLHKVLALSKPDQYNSIRIKVDLIYPSTWLKPQIHRAREFVLISPLQMTAFLITHKIPSKA